MSRPPILVLLVTVLVAACQRGPVVEGALVDATGRHALADGWRAKVRPLDARVGGRLRLLGIDAAERTTPGGAAALTLYWLVERECAGTEPRVFVHATAAGAELNIAQADHALVVGGLSATEWRPGDVLVDSFSLKVPAGIGVDRLSVLAGIYEGEERWAVDGVHDGAQRIAVATLGIDGAPPLDQRVTVPMAEGAFSIDGVLDEPAWRTAAILGPFLSYDGKSAVARGTTARMFWVPGALVLAFEADDPDPFTPYTQRDDPLYDSEAYEIFIDADGDQDAYVELQAAPNDLQFDAAFAGGRRKNMNRGFDARYVTKTIARDGKLVQEWRIDTTTLMDIPEGEPKPGASWRINLFRLERVRDAALSKVVKTEASAWSPPLSGDFHNIKRMGTIVFEERSTLGPR